MPIKKPMKNIFTFARREIKSHFDHPGGYVIIIVFLALALYLYFRTTVVVAEASMRNLFDLLPWLLLFLVPAISMRSLASDEKEGLSELFMAQPVTTVQFLLGKYLGALFTVLIGVFATLPVVLILSRFGSFDFGLVFAQYLGTIFLVAAMTAIGFFASGLTKNQVVSFIIGIAMIFAFIVIGWEAALGSMASQLTVLLQNLSILWHFSNITRGVLDFRDVVYFISVAAVFFTLAYWVFMRKRLARFSPAARKISSWLLAVILLAGVWTAAAQYIPLRIDLTSDRLYTLSSATKNILQNLKDTVTVKLYASEDLPTELSLAQRDVTDALNDYKSYGSGKLTVDVIHPNSDELKKEATNAGIPPMQFNVMRQGEFAVKEGYFGLTVSGKNSAAEAIPYISQTSDFEYQLSRLIRRISEEKRNQVVFLTGHRETGTAGYGGFRQELEKSFDVTDASISTATSLASSALANADVVVIAGAKEALSKNEEKILGDYVKNGGKAFVLADGADVNLQNLSASPASASTTAFIADIFGVKVDPNIVFDTTSNENVQFNTGGPMNFILPYPFWARVGAAQETPIMKDLKSVIYTWGSSLSILNDKLSGASAAPILKTTRNAGQQTTVFEIKPNTNFNIDKTQIGEKTVAVSVANVLGGNGRAIIAGSSSMLSDQILNGKPENIAFGLNTIDWLSENADLISIRSKISAPRTLAFASQNEQNTVKYSSMLGIPVLVAVFGGLWLYRRKRMTLRAYV
jgi:ABC-2 type transport system permease protein